jgi:microcystin-dependent protein
MARREYTAGRPTTLTAALSIGATSFTVADATNWPTSTDYDFWVTVDGGTAQEERILCSARTGTTVTVATRGADGTTESNHSAGATIWPSWSATDADEANAHINSTTNIHGVTGSIAPLASPTFTGTVVLPSATSIGNVSSTEIGYLDGVTSAVQTQINTVNTALTTNTPVGTIVMYGAATAPTGWLLCNGQSTAGYTALAAVVGANVPDLMGRVPVGYGSGSGLTARTTMNAKFGSESTTLDSTHIPEHAHTIGHGHAHTITANQAAHDHTIGWQADGTNDHDHALDSGSVTRVAGPSDGGTSSTGTIDTGNTDPAITVSGGVTNHTGNSGNYGTASPTAVTAMQPSTVVNFIIKH